MRKEAPSDEMSKNAQLLIREGFVYKEMAGIYTYLPLTLRVLENIKNIIRKGIKKLSLVSVGRSGHQMMICSIRGILLR